MSSFIFQNLDLDWLSLSLLLPLVLPRFLIGFPTLTVFACPINSSQSIYSMCLALVFVSLYVYVCVFYFTLVRSSLLALYSFLLLGDIYLFFGVLRMLGYVMFLQFHDALDVSCVVLTVWLQFDFK